MNKRLLKDYVHTIDKIGLYLTSLWLLFFLIIILKINIKICFENCAFVGFKNLITQNIIPTFSCIFLALGLFYFWCFNYRISGTSQIQVKINELKNKDYEHLTFLTTYIIPLICFDLEQMRYVLILAILLCIIGAIYVKTDLFYANPTLALLGYHIYEIDASCYINQNETEYKNITVVTKALFSKNDEIQMMRLDDKIFFGRKVE